MPARQDAERSIDMRFFSRPVGIDGSDRVERLTLERTRLTSAGRLEGTGDFEDLDVDLVIRSVGYRGEPMPDVPFDSDNNVIPSDNPESGEVLRVTRIVQFSTCDYQG